MLRAHFPQGSTSVTSTPLHDEQEHGLSSASRSNVTHKLRGPTALTPLCLLNVLKKDHLQRLLVRSAWYGKQTTSVRHEFILIQTEDALRPGLTRYLVLDRTVGDASQANVERTTSFFTLCVGTDALDSFWILYDDPGDKEQLLHGCRLDSYIFLKRIDFGPDKPLLLLALVHLALHVSESHPKYHPLAANCYWFAGLVWECLRKLRPTARHEVLVAGKRGKISFMQLLPDSVQVWNILRAIQPCVESYHECSEPVDSMVGAEPHDQV